VDELRSGFGLGPDLTSRDEQVSALIADMAERWDLGECPTAEEYLARYPDLADHPEGAVRLVYEEFCLREERGETVRDEEFYQRFPQWCKLLKALLDCHRLLNDGQPVAPAPPTTAPETLVDDFTLLTELGRGAQGCVYLARQRSLEDRPVVLKISPYRGREHLNLARLHHSYIVPLYAMHEDADRDRRVLCMPYFGGATLKDVLTELQSRPVPQRTGHDLIAALDRLQASSPVHLPWQGPARPFLSRLSYDRAISWLGVCLADALHHAHERGFVHLDVKPGNVLLAADGQPMLLDFHVAQQPVLADTLAPEGFGATLLYMSPEQNLALKAMELGLPVPQTVDGRSDIYTLGLVLYEALGGTLHSDRELVVSEQDVARLPVSPGLRAILARCLARKPKDRYAGAHLLAEDLRRHIKDLPLLGVRNHSWRERWQKWRRRQPAALPLAVMLGTVLLASLVLGGVYFSYRTDQLAQVQQALHEGKDQLQRQQYEQAATTLQTALEQANQLGAEATRAELEREGQRARRALLAQKLHKMADTFRFAQGGSVVTAEPVDSLRERWARVWDSRTQLLACDGLELDAALEQQIKTDYLDLALIWADLRVRLAGTNKDLARREALATLREAEESLGTSLVLCRQQQELATALGDTPTASEAEQKAATLTPRTTWEYSVLGRLYLQQEQLEKAADYLSQALERQPQDFWANFYYGHCAYQRKDYPEAASAFRVCLALAPEAAEVHYNFALAQIGLQQRQRALKALDRALQLKPAFAAAAFNRALLHHQEQRYPEALADLDRALQSGHDPAQVYHQLARVHLANQDPATALTAITQALQIQPEDEEARRLRDRLLRQ
jgi:serine/threonine protein kinase/Tfp pilus assembly protein PilF